MAKYAIRRLVRQPNGTVAPVWVDSETGQMIQDKSGYELVNELGGDQNLEVEKEESDEPSDKQDEEVVEPNGPSGDNLGSSSVYDNDTIFDQPDVPIRQATQSKANMGSKSRPAQAQKSTTPAVKDTLQSTSTTASKPSVSATPSTSGNLFKDYADKVSGAQGTLGNFNKTGLSQSAVSMADTVAKRGYEDLGVNSGYRDPQKNAAVGGANKSQHIQGNAIDLATKNLPDNVKADVLDSALVGGAKGIGLYNSGAMHIDTRQNPAFWGPSGYTGSDVKQMPDWSQDNLQALLDADGYQYLSKTNVPTPVERPDPDSIKSEMKTAQSLTPAQYASWGYTERTPEERREVAYALAGELSPKSLQGLMLGEPEAIEEASNILGAIENRSASKNLSISGVLDPTQVNSMMEANKGTTSNNYKSYQEAIDNVVNGFYGGKLADSLTAPSATHWANLDIVSPAWSNYAKDSIKTGDHTFFSDVMTRDNNAVEYGLPEFQAYESKPMADARENINQNSESSWANEASKDITSSPPDFGSVNDSGYSNSENYSSYGGMDSPSERGGRGLGESSRDSYSNDTINSVAESSWSSSAGKDIASSPPDFSGGSKSSSKNDYSAKGGEDSPGEGARGGLASWF